MLPLDVIEGWRIDGSACMAVDRIRTLLRGEEAIYEMPGTKNEGILWMKQIEHTHYGVGDIAVCYPGIGWEPSRWELWGHDAIPEIPDLPENM